MSVSKAKAILLVKEWNSFVDRMEEIESELASVGWLPKNEYYGKNVFAPRKIDSIIKTQEVYTNVS
jgi:hypothetical protein